MKKYQNNDLDEMKEWLGEAFSKEELVSNLYLIGSVFHKNQKETNDIDIVQQIQFENSPKLIEYAQTISLIRESFVKRFLKPLHVTTFTQNESKEFEEFMSKNVYTKIV